MSIYQKLAVATATAALSLAAMEAKTVQAATIVYDFTVDVTSGPLTGTQYFGSFSYDDLTLTGTGLETLGVDEGLSISFDFLGKTYNETSDIDLPDYPIVQFQDQSLLGLNFNVFYGSSFQSFAIANEVDASTGAVGSGGGNVFAYDTDPSVAFEGLGTVTYQPVPEPISVVGLSVLGLGCLLKKKVRSSRKRKATVDIVG